MKIYRNTFNIIIPGLGNGSIDREEVWLSGYTTGYGSGYTDGSAMCGDIDVQPLSIGYPVEGGSRVLDITTANGWQIDADGFGWRYGDDVWTGYSAEDLNRLSVSPAAGEGDGEASVSAPDLSGLLPVFVGLKRPTPVSGYLYHVYRRSGTLTVEAEGAWGDPAKYVSVSQELPKWGNPSFASSGGSVSIMLDKGKQSVWDEDLAGYEIRLVYKMAVSTDPWSGYTTYFRGTMDELPNIVNLPIPSYTSSLLPYLYDAAGNITGVYWDLRFFKEGVHNPSSYGLCFTIEKPKDPVLYVTTDLPEPITGETGTYIHIPSTGATYTFTVSGNTSWTAGTDIYRWDFSPSGGNVDEITVSTFTFPPIPGDEGRITNLYIAAYPIPETGYTDNVNRFIWLCLQETPKVEKYVADLIDEGYANFIQSGGTYKGGNYVEILSSCPYSMSDIVDLEEVALNQKQLSGLQNTIVWNQILPSGWSAEDIAAIYDGQSLNYTPRGGQFWAITSAVSSFTITYAGDSYVTSDYPWGSYTSEGVFAPRWNYGRQSEYIANGWLSTPETVTVNFTSSFSSVGQVMFTQMKGTRHLIINQQSGTFACHDVTGMFEGNTVMEQLTINGNFNWSTWRTCHNVFDGCDALTGIPYCATWSRTAAQNELYPHHDGARGSADCRHLFNVPALEYLGPVINMGAISLSGCTYAGRSQAALSDTLFNCPVLEDVLIKNLNNNDWNFTDASTFTRIPRMNVASIEYLLNNVEDVTADPHTITFSTLHQGEISQSALDNAAAKGWTITYA